ncbi:sensor histidine kinase [Moheibacter lacus]|uniref:histidine kinase n=1 Tax=Moheibacter lacus TaxID=2745851 RepID=A0A838ZRT4_9FLAO|nr:HAMP domain-containing sensor histidine kinase [Moheibacter lacus]MBA5629542.1 HAMP domain-containing histidine kinase [Moheibacter lacus]
MKPKNQIKILIISCLVILGGLISIQYYLIQNTYQLISETYVNEVKKEIAPVIESPELDSLEDQFVSEIKKIAWLKAQDSINEIQFHLQAQSLSDSIRNLSQKYLKSQWKDYPILKEVQLKFQLKQIVFITEFAQDTILRLVDPPLVYIGQRFDGNGFHLSSGITQTSEDLDLEDENLSTDFFYKHSSTVNMDISNFQQKIWNKMKWMLIGAFCLILAVIYLFYHIFRSFIKQKKIAEIKTDFANNITHELKTPLASLNLIIQSLQKKEVIENPEILDQMIQSMERQNNRIQNIVDRVLESSVDEQKIQLKKVEIVQFLNEFLADYHSENHQIILAIEPKELFLETDTYQLGRVLQNLLQNAEKYSPKGSEILINGFQNHSDYIIEIQDSGMGIPASEQEKIFEKFYRVSEGNRHDAKGLGLGLYLCKQIMKGLGGNILVQSSLKKGSTFILKIPVS